MTNRQQETIADPPHKYVTCDAVYREAYTEMRRFRDYEQIVAAWFSSILVAMIGGLIAVKTGAVENGKSIGDLIAFNCWVQFFVATLIVSLGCAGSWSSRYATARYKEIRSKVTNHLEPPFAKEQLKPKSHPFSPGEVIFAIPILTSIVALWVLLIPPVQTCRWCLGVGGTLIAIVFAGWCRLHYSGIVIETEPLSSMAGEAQELEPASAKPEGGTLMSEGEIHDGPADG